MRTALVLSGVGAALAVLMIGAPTYAQQTLIAAAPPTDRETDVSVSADALFDSNVARSDLAVARMRGIPSLADELFTPSVDFAIARPIGREVLFVRGDAGYEFHRADTILNREHVDLQAGVNAHIGPCHEIPTGEYSVQQNDLAEQSLAALKNTVTTDVVGLSLDCGRQTGFAPQASITQTWRDNSAPVFLTTNNEVSSVTGAMAYRQPALGALSIFGNYAMADFPDRLNPMTTTRQTYGYVLYAGGVSYDRHLGGRIEGVISVSYTVLDPNTPVSPSFQGFTYSFDATYHMNYRTNFHVLASRATTPSTRLDSNYSVDETYEADVSYTLGPRISFTLTGLRKSQNYHTNTNAVVVDLTQDTIDSVTALVTYTFNTHLALIFNVGEEGRSANFPGLNYSSTKAGFTIKATY